MKKQMKELQELFNSILCLCAEGIEFMTRVELAESISKEATKGYDLCKEKRP